MMRKGLVIGIALLSCTVHADEKAAEYRENVMEAVGGHMQAIVKIAKGEVSHPDHLGVLATNLAGLARISKDIFPAGSNVGESEARKEIWAQPEAFAERLEAFETAAADLDAVVRSGDMSGFGPALQALGQSCKSCHDDFKKD